MEPRVEMNLVFSARIGNCPFNWKVLVENLWNLPSSGSSFQDAAADHAGAPIPGEQDGKPTFAVISRLKSRYCRNWHELEAGGGYPHGFPDPANFQRAKERSGLFSAFLAFIVVRADRSDLVSGERWVPTE